MRQHVGHGAAVLALQVVDQLQPLGHRVQAGGIEVQPAPIAAHLFRHVLQLVERALGARAQRIEGVVIGSQRAQFVHRAAHRRQRAAACLRGGLVYAPGRVRDALECGESAPFLLQLLLLPIAQARRLDFGNRVPEQLGVPLAVLAARLQFHQPRPRGGQPAMQRRQPFDERHQAAEVIEQASMFGLAQQALVAVLAVQVEQSPAELAELGGGYRCTGDEAA